MRLFKITLRPKGSNRLKINVLSIDVISIRSALRQGLFIVLALAFISLGSTLQAQVGGGPPNIVFFYADDMGNGDISFNTLGSSYARTPGIDRIFKQGIYLSNHLTHSMCSPSRAGMLTGRHYTEVGSALSVGGSLDVTVPNIARDFQSNGYTTGCFGKWHNGPPPRSNRDDIFSVNEYGFDVWTGFYGGSSAYVNRLDNGDVAWWDSTMTSGTDEDDKLNSDIDGYTTEIIGGNVRKFIEDAINSDEPFFAYVPFGIIHTPYNIFPRQLQEFCNLIDDDYPSFSWANVGAIRGKDSGRRIDSFGPQEPLFCDDGNDFEVNDIEDDFAGFSELIYYAMMYVMDKQVSSIVEMIAEDQGVFENTIFVFSSDNGATRSGDNAPFQGYKITLWEGGTHVPAAIWWPGRLGDAILANGPVADNGLEYPHMTQYLDWYPTLMSAAGLNVDPTAELDGLSFFSQIDGDGEAVRDLENADHHYYGLGYTRASVSNGRYKLLYNHVPGEFNETQLYNVESDVGEANNLKNDEGYSGIVSDLSARLDDWFGSGEVTASYMRLPHGYANSNPRAAPAGDVLRITATQDGPNSSILDNPLYMKIGNPDWDGLDLSERFFPGDILEYDIYVAGDADQTSGMIVTPTYREAGVGSVLYQPSVNWKRGVGLNNDLSVKQTFPKGQWVRCALGVGDIAPYRADRGAAIYVGFFAPAAGDYEFYLDNIVVRKPDGTERVVIWRDRADTTDDVDRFLYFNNSGLLRSSNGSVPADTPFTSASFGVANADDLPGPGIDTEPPMPNPLSWVSTNATDTTITMTAETATDPSGVSYFFQWRKGTDAWTNSSWVTEPSFTATGLVPDSEYTLHVMARDGVIPANMGSWSAPITVRTSSAVDTLPPTPNPLSWVSTNATDTTITMTAETATDPSGVSYFFNWRKGTDAWTNSGWVTEPSFTATGLVPDSEYTLYVMARDGGIPANMGSWSAPITVRTSSDGVSRYEEYLRKYYTQLELDSDPTLSSFVSDHDGDSLQTIAEYYFGTNPRVANEISDAISYSMVDLGVFEFRFKRIKDESEVSGGFVGSTNLNSWTELTSLEVSETVEDAADTDYESVVARVSVAERVYFIRYEITASEE